MNTNYLRVLVAVVAILLLTSATLRASEMDDRIESAAKNSYVFKTYLKGDDIKIESKDGAVTLTGTVADESHKSLARETVASLPGVKSVDNRLELKSERPAEHSDAWLGLKVKMLLLFHRNPARPSCQRGPEGTDHRIRQGRRRRQRSKERDEGGRALRKAGRNVGRED
jgi:hyperosmotically inducible protein